MTEPVDEFTQLEWFQFVAPETVEFQEGRTVMRLEPRRAHLNFNGTVSGPIVYALAEMAGGSALVATMVDQIVNAYMVTESARIEYLAPTRGTTFAIAEVPVDVVERIRSSLTQGVAIEADVHVSVQNAGREVARCDLRFAFRPRRRARR